MTTHHHLLTYAINIANNKFVYVMDVPNGSSCLCKCPYCGELLIAKNKGRKKAAHFAHKVDSKCNHQAAFESEIHLLSKAIIAEEKAIMVPSFYTEDGQLHFKSRVLRFSNVDVEKKINNDLTPDCIGYIQFEDGTQLEVWIEINNTHAVDENKKKYVMEHRIYCIEVDVNQFYDREKIDKEELRTYLLSDVNARRWIYYPVIIKHNPKPSPVPKPNTIRKPKYDLIPTKTGWVARKRQRF